MHAGHARQAMLLGQAHKLVHAVRRFIGQTNVADLACLDQPGQRLQLLANRRLAGFLFRVVVQIAEGRHMALGPVDLVEVDHIGLQAAQAGVAGGHDVRRRHALALTHPRHAARWAGHLAGQHHLVAQPRVGLEPVADDGLGGAIGFGAGGHRIHLRRVPEIHAALQRVAEHRMGIGFTDLLAKRHRAQANGRNLQITAAKEDVLHKKNSAKSVKKTKCKSIF